MIIHSFDPHTDPVFGPEHLYGPAGDLLDILIVTFSSVVRDHALKHYAAQQIAVLPGLNGDNPIWRLTDEPRRVGFIMSPITSAHCGMTVEEAAQATGCRHVVLFGSCGALDAQLTEGRLIVPTHSYRDEGYSYHYAPADDYITVKNAPKVAAVLQALDIPFVLGRAWTTDAIFRETKGNMDKRRQDGCIAVDMECAGLQAMCDHRGYQYYTFFYTGDLLDAPAWEKRILADASEIDHQLANFQVALEIARRITL